LSKSDAGIKGLPSRCGGASAARLSPTVARFRHRSREAPQAPLSWFFESNAWPTAVFFDQFDASGFEG